MVLFLTTATRPFAAPSEPGMAALTVAAAFAATIARLGELAAGEEQTAKEKIAAINGNRILLFVVSSNDVTILFIRRAYI